jgi:type I pantothenate kinase
VLRTLIERWPSSPRVQIVSTDSFLRPNSELDPAGLTMQKGFPVSYDTDALIAFLAALRAGVAEVSVPVYSHVTYDVVPDEVQLIERTDVVILEGVNVLQAAPASAQLASAQLVSDHLDLSVYVDATEADIEQWFVDRFAVLRREEYPDGRAFYRQFATLSDEESEMVARWTWSEINLVNLREHIAPTRDRAHVVLEKSADHLVSAVWVRDV